MEEDEEFGDDVVEVPGGAAEVVSDGPLVVVLRTMAARAPTPAMGTPSGTMNGVPAAQTALSEAAVMELQQYEGIVFVISYSTMEQPASGLIVWQYCVQLVDFQLLSVQAPRESTLGIVPKHRPLDMQIAV